MMRLKIIWKVLLIGGLLLGKVLVGNAQVSVAFNPGVHGQSIEGLVYAQLMNTTSSSLTARVTIRVRDTRGYSVVTIVTPSFVLLPGVNPLNKTAFSRSRFSFSNNEAGYLLSQSGQFPEGEYEFCYEVDISDSKNPSLSPVYENCFLHQLQPRTPLLLINPIDGEEFCNVRPNFVWQPPIPLPRNARFRLVLTEVREKQDIVEAVTYNPPIVNQGNIPGNTLLYPANAPYLQEGKKYAWQVIVYAGKTILGRSEVWTFISKCDEQQPVINTDSYRELKETDDGGFYVAGNVLRFSLRNPYGPGNLQYSIVSTEAPAEPLKGLPALQLQSGLNKYQIDLSQLRGFKNDGEYKLLVSLPNNRRLSLRFIYKTE